MSIRVMTAVWDKSTASGSELLLLLAIADNAHDNGTGAWPSVSTLAKKTRQSERNVQYLLRKLEEIGELETIENGGPNRSNSYRIRLPEGEAAFRVKTLQGENQRTERVQTSAEEGAKAFTQTVLEPSLDPSVDDDDARAPAKRSPEPDYFEDDGLPPAIREQKTYILEMLPLRYRRDPDGTADQDAEDLAREGYTQSQLDAARQQVKREVPSRLPFPDALRKYLPRKEPPKAERPKSGKYSPTPEDLVPCKDDPCKCVRPDVDQYGMEMAVYRSRHRHLREVS